MANAWLSLISKLHTTAGPSPPDSYQHEQQHVVHSSILRPALQHKQCVGAETWAIFWKRFSHDTAEGFDQTHTQTQSQSQTHNYKTCFACGTVTVTQHVVSTTHTTGELATAAEGYSQ